MFYFPFYVINFYIKKKDHCRRWRSSEVVVVSKTLQRGIVDDGSARCDSRLFCDALLVRPVLLSECRNVSNTNRSHDSPSRFEFLSGVLVRELFRFPLTRSSFPPCCGSSSCVLEEG